MCRKLSRVGFEPTTLCLPFTALTANWSNRMAIRTDWSTGSVNKKAQIIYMFLVVAK